MSHFTLGHLLYVVAAVDALWAIWMVLSLRNIPAVGPDGTGNARNARLMLAASTFASAIFIGAIATFTSVAATPLF
jgi:hypothetical protein